MSTIHLIKIALVNVSTDGVPIGVAPVIGAIICLLWLEVWIKIAFFMKVCHSYH